MVCQFGMLNHSRMMTRPVPCHQHKILPRWAPHHQKALLRHRHFPNAPEVSATETLPCPAQQPDLNKWSGDVNQTDWQAAPALLARAPSPAQCLSYQGGYPTTRLVARTAITWRISLLLLRNFSHLLWRHRHLYLPP
jgi:hypothetical protein